MQGHRILVVEDDAIFSMWITDLLVEAGAAVLGPAPNARIAQRWLAAEPDAAVVNLLIGGNGVRPLLDQLSAARIPMVFIAGQNGPDLSDFEAVPRVSKLTLGDSLLPTLGAVLPGTLSVAQPAKSDRPVWV